MSDNRPPTPKRGTIANLESIVFKGPFTDQGMPDFTGTLKADEATKIKAFIQGTADALLPCIQSCSHGSDAEYRSWLGRGRPDGCLIHP